jgi:hypothetical protein
VTTQFGQKRANQPGQSIDVADGQTVESVDVLLPRAAVVAGQLLDQRGDPVIGAAVQIVRQQFVEGRRQLVAAAADADLTDERGQFRIYGIPPGTYVLAATMSRPRRVDQSDEIMPVGIGGVGGTTMFYPGTPAVSMAQPLVLAAAQDMTGLAFAWPAPRLATISGIVRTVEGQPPAAARVSIDQPMAFAPNGMSSAGFVLRPDGTFAIPDLPPGTYTLITQSRDDQDVGAVAVVALDGADQRVTMVLRKGAVLRGKVAFDTGAPPANVRPTSSMVSASRGTNPDALPPSGKRVMNEDWTFEVGGLTGSRWLDTRPPAGWGLKSIRRGSADVTDVPLNFDSGDIEGVEILFTAKLTGVSIGVHDRDGRSTADATVVLFPEDRAKWGMVRYAAALRPNQSGRFLKRGLPAGRYLAAAIEFLDAGDETNPAALEKLQVSATRLTLTDGDTRELELTLSTGR